MKRYLIFVAVGPALGGFVLLLATTYQSGYWTETNAGEIAKLFKVFVVSLQFSYLFGFLPALMICAIDDILFHVSRIGPVPRLTIPLTALITVWCSSSCTGWSASSRPRFPPGWYTNMSTRRPR
jgi:hypothetical protein